MQSLRSLLSYSLLLRKVMIQFERKEYIWTHQECICSLC
jgi:hypothetical protein